MLFSPSQWARPVETVSRSRTRVVVLPASDVASGGNCGVSLSRRSPG